jgi:M-phase inducer tyrosine phosphatase
LIKQKNKNFIIFDCRSEEEFAAGHIKEALNMPNKNKLFEFLFDDQNRFTKLVAQGTILIFHCEFSERRAPILYKSLREKDREINLEIYPKLFFPEIYII